MQAVIWTDFLASITLIVGVSVALAIAMNGIEGGSSELWRTAIKNDMVAPRGFFNLSPLETVNFWSMFIGIHPPVVFVHLFAQTTHTHTHTHTHQHIRKHIRKHTCTHAPVHTCDPTLR